MIISVDDVKKSLLPEMMADVDLSLIEDLINAITEIVERYTNTYIKYGTYTEIFDGNSEVSVIPLKGIKIWSIDKVKFSDVEHSLSLFKIHDRLCGIYSSVGFPEGTLNIEIIYKAGYDTTLHPAPDGLKRAIIDEVVLRYNYLRTQSRTGEQIVDLTKDFLDGESYKYFNRIRRNVW